MFAGSGLSLVKVQLQFQEGVAKACHYHLAWHDWPHVMQLLLVTSLCMDCGVAGPLPSICLGMAATC